MGVNKIKGMYTCDVCGRHEGERSPEEGGSDGE